MARRIAHALFPAPALALSEVEAAEQGAEVVEALDCIEVSSAALADKN